MGVGMSIRHGAWVFGVPCCLKIEYENAGPATHGAQTPTPPGVYRHSGHGRAKPPEGTATPKELNFITNLDFPMKMAFFAKRPT
jgi:hypothetical protein